MSDASLVALVVICTLVAVVLYANTVTGEKKIEEVVTSPHAVADDGFRRELAVLLGADFRPGNDVQLLRNGDEIFPAMLGAIRGARRSICLETFVYWSGQTGEAFAQALCERAAEGVAVHVLLDWLGTQRMRGGQVQRLRDAGVEVRRYHGLRLNQLRRLNNRTHRKLLVVDGEVALTGGTGIADVWRGHAQDPAHWRDSHFRVRGPVVAQMQAVFLDNWIKATGCLLHGDGYFPPLQAQGTILAHCFSSSPQGGSARMHLMYLLAIASARSRILVANAYFVPDRFTTRALVDAARRGVEVRVLVPGPHTDAPFLQIVSRTLWPRLLAAGIRIAEYQPTMFHCKVMVVDDLLVSFGSSNFDSRSLRLNDEANVNVLDAQFARAQAAVFEEDWSRSRAVRPQDVDRRSPAFVLGRMGMLLRREL